MIRARNRFSFLQLPLIFLLAAQMAVAAAPSDTTASKTAVPPWVSDATEGNIARLTARILERSHYAQKPFDDEVSGKFLDRYLEALDGLHLMFLKSDLDEFEPYRTTLDDLTLKKGDTSPAHQIFSVLVKRMEQRVNYATNLLQTETFDFHGDDRYLVNRKDAPRPKDLTEAKALWRQHLRYEYLQEKLMAGSGTNGASGVSRKPGTDGNTNATRAAKKGEPQEIVKTLASRYNRLLHTLKDFSDDEVFELYLTALTHVYDPHSDYMGKSQMENFAIQMKLSLFGIGALLESEDGYCQIKELVPGPAQRSKQLKPKDRIVAVAQGEKEPVEVVGVKLSKVVEMIRGPKGTEVRLTVLPVDATDPSVRKVITLVREEIKLEDQEAKARVIDLPNPDGRVTRLGVIDLPSFYEDFGFDATQQREHKSTTADVAKLLKKLKQEEVAGVILDLRRNGGGALNEAINLTGLFIKRGPVVQVKDPDGRIMVDFDRDPGVLYDGPLVVLTSRFSASASEILAGALQDYGRALIVGDSSTHGKGTVQSLVQLDAIMKENDLTYSFNPGALKVTIRKFYRASGSSTQLKGVIPDIVLPSVNNFAEVGEASLENALPWDEIRSADYEKLNRVEPLLPELRRRAARRVESEKDFAYVREDIELFKRLQADKTVSLNEEKRLKEKLEIDARNEARKKERAARHEVEPKIFEITLKNAGLPGLPEPAKKTNDVARADSAHAPMADEDLPTASFSSDALTLEEAERVLTDFITLSEERVRARSLAR